jgi:hypothetical protein
MGAAAGLPASPRRPAFPMILKSLIVVHRYVGVVLGVLMTLWCISGFVMMYQPYPATTQAERAAGLESLNLAQCCADLPLTDTDPLGNARIEMLNGVPVLRANAGGSPATYDLSTGAELSPLSESAIRQVAQTFAAGNNISGQIASLATIHNDQWTVQGARRWQPLWHATFDDPAGSYVYINGKTGEVVQDANAHERFWTWLGAIPHWLYPTVLRENAQLWNEVVIWSSAIGCFLVITGIVIGVIRLRARSGKWWPYRNRPIWMWHHVLGTFAGILILTWTFSGLLTMSPWGLLQSKPAIAREAVASTMTLGDARSIIARAKSDPALAGAIALRAAPFMDKPYLIALARDGREIRLGLDGPAPLTQGELEAGLQARGGLLASGKLDVLTTEDDYYYGHKQPVAFPVYRLTLQDPDQTHIYFNATTGDPRIIDATSKRYRWWESGLHSLDFAFMRARPVWDIITLILLAAVTLACGTGMWMSFTRVGADISRLKEMLKRK